MNSQAIENTLEGRKTWEIKQEKRGLDDGKFEGDN